MHTLLHAAALLGAALPAQHDRRHVDVAEVLARIHARHPVFETVYEVYDVGNLATLDPAEAPTTVEGWIGYSRLRRVVERDRYRIEQLPPTVADALPKALELAVWDGEKFMTKTQGRPAIRVTPTQMMVFADCGALFNECPGAVLAAAETLLGSVVAGEVIEQTLDGDVVTHRYRSGAEYELRLELGARPRLLSYAVEVRGDEADEMTHDGLMTRWHYHVAEWKAYDGHLVPQRAYRDCFFMNRQEDPPVWTLHREIYLRASYERLDGVDPSAFEITPESGDQVLDLRYRTTWRVGSNQLVVDGVDYVTADAARGDPSENLAAILRGAEPIGSANRAGAADRAEERFVPAILVYAGAPLLLAAAAWLGARRRHAGGA